jgi:hypothetical protein
MENGCNEFTDKVVDKIVKPTIENTQNRIINFLDDDVSPSLKKANDNMAEFIIGAITAMAKDIFKRKD